jgi:hypothetical protein
MLPFSDKTSAKSRLSHAEEADHANPIWAAPFTYTEERGFSGLFVQKLGSGRTADDRAESRATGPHLPISPCDALEDIGSLGKTRRTE